MSVQNPCRHHPDREGRVYCQKYNHYYCGDCIRCRQPKAHCKFRTACLIWEFEKYGIPDDLREPDDAREVASEVASEDAYGSESDSINGSSSRSIRGSMTGSITGSTGGPADGSVTGSITRSATGSTTGSTTGSAGGSSAGSASGSNTESDAETPPEPASRDGRLPRVRFEPDGTSVQVPPGTLLHEAARDAGVFVAAACNGKGVCGRCRVQVVEGEVEPSNQALFLTEEEREAGHVLACQAPVHQDLTVRVPTAARQRQLQILEDVEGKRQLRLGDQPTTSLVTSHALTLAEPSLGDPTADLDRLSDRLVQQGSLSLPSCPLPVGVSLDAVREISRALRTGQWNVTVDVLERSCGYEVIRARASASSGAAENGAAEAGAAENGTAEAGASGDVTTAETTARLYGVALDIGTTALSAELVDLSTGDILGRASSLNAQVACGDDVLSRILCAAERGGIDRLHAYVTDTVNNLVREMADARGIDPEEILAVSVAGNTVMTHTLLRLDPASIRAEPYVPVATTLPVLTAAELGLAVHPRAGVFVLPGTAAYVGGDITSGVVASGLARREETTLFIDVGTNGEMVLGNQDWMLTAACSAGPAFEGGGIQCGMRAIPGAIETLRLDPDTLQPSYTVVGGQQPQGLCGSGLIDLLSELLLHGVIEPNGKLASGVPADRVVDTPFGRGFLVGPARESATGQDIVFTEPDIETLVRTKGAVYGGIQTLLTEAGLTPELVDRILVAGGFGQHLDLDRAVAIGLLPDVDRARFTYLGNTSLVGAYLTLVSRAHREEAARVARAMTYQDFSSSGSFFDQYQQALFLPHTDLRQFPTVAARLGNRGTPENRENRDSNAGAQAGAPAGAQTGSQATPQANRKPNPTKGREANGNAA
jgi:uncharacterized 2Fe-2S/4Fe-4S cluster protein (DUF4445 family)